MDTVEAQLSIRSEDQTPGRAQHGRMMPKMKTLKSLIKRYYFRTVTKKRLRQNRGKANRRLEIGPGDRPIDGFESLNIIPGPGVDYVWDAAGRLPFDDGSFELVYASHILEHIPWYQTLDGLKEWVRILERGGQMEIWVPDGLKICKAFVDAEIHDENYIDQDGWYKFNAGKDPCIWAAGRTFTYGDGTGSPDSPNWHRALFSPRYLMQLMERAGLTKVERMELNEVRGYNHGWINLGVRGTKP